MRPEKSEEEISWFFPHRIELIKILDRSVKLVKFRNEDGEFWPPSKLGKSSKHACVK
jgi:hypothetical protein